MTTPKPTSGAVALKAPTLEEIRVFEAARNGGWKTAIEIGAGADIDDGTARDLCNSLAADDVFEATSMAGGRWYRVNAHPGPKGRERIARILAATRELT